jgi:hypothetical protein
MVASIFFPPPSFAGHGIRNDLFPEIRMGRELIYYIQRSLFTVKKGSQSIEF